MPNRSPTRWPKLVGGFHLPSAVCPPSEISGKPKLLQARLLGLDSGSIPGGTAGCQPLELSLDDVIEFADARAQAFAG
jgi:hypothetical protein